MKNIKKLEENFFLMLMRLSTTIIIIALLLILISIIYKGLPALSLDMLTKIPEGGFYFGKSGGILNAIIGSLYISLGATILAFIIGLPVALYMNVYIYKKKKLVNIIRFLLDLLWGIPSIVYGAFGFAIMILMGIKTSLLAGIITVTLFIIPIMIRSMDEVLKTVPGGLMEASLSLGATRSQTAFKVFFRSVFRESLPLSCYHSEEQLVTLLLCFSQLVIQILFLLLLVSLLQHYLYLFSFSWVLQY